MTVKAAGAVSRLPAGARCALGALLLASCSGGRIVVPCDEVPCIERCRSEGAEAGTCTAAGECVCVAPLDTPGGLQISMATGGTANRSGGGYQLSLTLGPVSVGTVRGDDTHSLEVGSTIAVEPRRGR